MRKLEQLLIDILYVQSPSNQEEQMIKFILNYCHGKGYKCEYHDNNVYITKGTSEVYPCFVAHTDTCIRKILADDEYSIETFHREIFAWNHKTDKQTQVGFDDKVGIFIALKMIDHLPAAKGFFPYAEEVGCVGSGKAVMEWFNDVTYAIQCDRKGCEGITDKICGTEVMSEEFKTLLKKPMDKFKRKFVNGGLTDVYKLKTLKLPVVCMNIECGYYKPHQEEDFAVIDEIYLTLSFVKEIVKVAGIKKWAHEYKPYVYTYNYTKTTYSYPNKYDNKYGKVGARDYEDWEADDWGWGGHQNANFHNHYQDKHRKTDTKQLALPYNVNAQYRAHCECCDEYKWVRYVYNRDVVMCDECEKAYSIYYPKSSDEIF